MKKFLSIILALAILIVPIGSLSSFAAGEKDIEDIINSQELDWEYEDLTMMLVSIFFTLDGYYKVSFVFFGEDQRVLGRINVPEGTRLRQVEDFIDELDVRDKMIELGSCKSLIMLEADANSDKKRMFSTFFNSKGKIIDILEGVYDINQE